MGAGGSIAAENPATGEIIGHVPNLGVSETREAIAAAERAHGDTIHAHQHGKRIVVVRRRHEPETEALDSA